MKCFELAEMVVNIFNKREDHKSVLVCLYHPDHGGTNDQFTCFSELMGILKRKDGFWKKNVKSVQDVRNLLSLDPIAKRPLFSTRKSTMSGCTTKPDFIPPFYSSSSASNPLQTNNKRKSEEQLMQFVDDFFVQNFKKMKKKPGPKPKSKQKEIISDDDMVLVSSDIMNRVSLYLELLCDSKRYPECESIKLTQLSNDELLELTIQHKFTYKRCKNGLTKTDLNYACAYWAIDIIASIQAKKLNIYPRPLYLPTKKPMMTIFTEQLETKKSSNWESLICSYLVKLYPTISNSNFDLEEMIRFLQKQ